VKLPRLFRRSPRVPAPSEYAGCVALFTGEAITITGYSATDLMRILDHMQSVSPDAMSAHYGRSAE
jgi:hypothetical protein